ncbi:OmpA family protein [Vibrio japonicus]|uniref:OmpA family protein n=1 Tax=Vibrio japonicus TaxID=1824638 RepID=A0ABY5LKE8_9VIBR|nr:OmpA family protein [Vibrio japonicus]UUM31252.1 OmpA family protein [Vibrio japonicus]
MKKLAAVISASLLFASTPSLAEVYVGAKAGKSWLDDACSASATCDDDDSTVGAFVGYEMWDFLSIEAGYDYLGKFTGDGLNDEKVEAITLAPKLSLPITDAIALYGKVGGAYVDYGNKDDYSYLGAAGIEFGTNQNVNVRLEYQTLTDVNNDLVRAEANSATLGIVYKFGGSEEVVEPVVVEEMVEEVVVEEPVVVTKTFSAKRLGTESFEVNSSQLKAESAAKLDDLVKFLNDYPQANVEIVGYTDTSGAASYNQALSEKRAQSVADALTAKGVDASRISARGEGENNPIVSNETLEGRQQNRRVEIIVPEFEYQVQQ